MAKSVWDCLPSSKVASGFIQAHWIAQRVIEFHGRQMRTQCVRRCLFTPRVKDSAAFVAAMSTTQLRVDHKCEHITTPSRPMYERGSDFTCDTKQMVEFGSGHDWLAIMHYDYHQFNGWSEINVAVTEVEREEMIREIYELRHYILVEIGASHDELILCDRLRDRIELACSMIPPVRASFDTAAVFREGKK